MSSPSRTVWDVHAKEALVFSIGGSSVRVQYIHKSGRLARLVVSAPREVSVCKDSEVRSKHGTLSPA